MLDTLADPIVIAIVLLVLLILIAVPVLWRRRRASREEVLPPPELGPPVDYTAEDYEEPVSMGDRLRQAPIGVKLLLGLVPLALIIAGVVVWLTLFNTPPTPTTPPPPPPEISNVVARLAAPARIVVEADTNLADNTMVTATMKDGDHDLPWFAGTSASGQASGGHISLVMEKAPDAPPPTRGVDQTIVLVATVNGAVVTSSPATLSVPSIYQGQFYSSGAAQPTAAPQPTASAQPTAVPAATATPESTVTPAPTLKAKVFNGGNIRANPKIEPCNCAQLHAGEEVTLLERTENRTWYRVQAPDGEGWVSATLLTLDPAVASQVPVATPAPASALKAKVSNGGNIRTRPKIETCDCAQLHAGEEVTLLERTADSTWYRVQAPGGEGWVSATLLTIDAAVAKQVPVAK